MGDVYRGVDTRLDRPVAIKVSAEQFGGHLNREAQAIAALNHPNICTLYDVGPDYLVMELVEGETLASRLDKGALPIELVVQYGVDCPGASKRARQAHRTSRPEAGQRHGDHVGSQSARLWSGEQLRDETQTVTNAIVGTPAYMSPEQLVGGGRHPHRHLRVRLDAL